MSDAKNHPRGKQQLFLFCAIVPAVFLYEILTSQELGPTSHHNRYIAQFPPPSTSNTSTTVNPVPPTVIHSNPLMHGYLKKSGMPPDIQILRGFGGERVELYFRWLTDYFGGRRGGGVEVMHPSMALGQNPGEGCQVLINHHYKFIWIKGYKVGGTAARASLGNICGDRWKVPEDSSFEFCSSHLTDVLAFDVDKITTDMEHATLSEWWKDYFVFSVVRNPFSRFASAYEFSNKRMPEKCKKPSFEESCSNPYSHVASCERCCPQEVYFHAAHFSNQSTCLFTQDGRPAVDFLGHTERLTDDLETILNEINNRKPSGLPELGLENIAKNSNKRHSQNDVGKNVYFDLFNRSKNCADEVVRNYRQDFELLGFDKTLEGIV
ncbi:hypothetical protein BSKO_11308 [Bryopsis sp. KO-2023]|nr:hypothetical protein BSKO_11308 [Bryopsis sp. KO-2023]